MRAVLLGGPRDGYEIEVGDAPPGHLDFPERTELPSLGVPAVLEPEFGIRAVRYRLLPQPRCCATWCTWPRPCSCCPRCVRKAAVYVHEDVDLRVLA